MAAIRRERLHSFLNTIPNAPEMRNYYSHPTCANAEVLFSNLLRVKPVINQERVMYMGLHAASAYTARVQIDGEWFDNKGQTFQFENVRVLVKNPRGAGPDEELGERNALILLEDTAYIGVPNGNGFSVVRPVRGINSQGIDYQRQLSSCLINVFQQMDALQTQIPKWIDEN